MEELLEKDELSWDEFLELPTEIIESLLEENEEMKRKRASIKFHEFKTLSLKPQLVLDCIGYLRQNQCVLLEGLFRIPGTNAVVEEIREAYSRSEYEDVLSVIPEVDANVVATTLKGYFRLLDDPIIPNDLYEDFMDLADAGPIGEKEIQIISDKVRTMPSPNKEVLCYLMLFLREVTAQEAVNQMKPRVLATCIAPSLMRFTGDGRKETGKMMALAELGFSIKILTTMLENIDFMEILTEETYDDMNKACKYVLRGAPIAPVRGAHVLATTAGDVLPPPGIGEAPELPERKAPLPPPR